MRTSTSTISAATLMAGLASAVPSAIIIIEASHGGAGNGLTNNTITVPIGPVYTNASALAEVSTLYLTGAVDADASAITCTPYKSTDGTGIGGLPFNISTFSPLSTNTVTVGSIVCTESSSSYDTVAASAPPQRRSNGTLSSSVVPTPAGTGVGSLTTGHPTAVGGNGSVANVTSTLLVQPTPTAAATGSTGTSTPNTSAAMGISIPYAMSALLLGAAGVMFSL